jgi:predicted ATP-grasp superfamily ATP-dependent carboligase
MPETLVILGASARAAAFSAMRAGIPTFCADLFADADLVRRSPAIRVDDYPAGLAAAADRAPPGHWMYTGALENYPHLVDRIAAGRSLLGNAGAELKAVRDPRRLFAAFSEAGIAVAPWKTSPKGLPCDGTWLRKAKRSAGGLQVEVWLANVSPQRRSARFYFQQRLSGQACGAVYAASRDRVVLLGITEPILDPEWREINGDAPPNSRESFQYRGSLGPFPVDETTRNQFLRIGELLHRDFGLRGIFGIDAVIAGGAVHPLEVNPRYPASAEILERLSGQSAVALHVAACRNELPTEIQCDLPQCYSGKAILYATEDVVVGPGVESLLGANPSDDEPSFADLPVAGSRIPAGSPLLTVLADGTDRSDVLNRLKQLAEIARDCLRH